MPANERLPALVRAAQAEGSLTVNLRADLVAPELERAFEDQYGIDLQIVNPGTARITRQQILQEARAGKVRSDVIESYVHEMDTIYAESHVITHLPRFLRESALDPSLTTEFSAETFQYPFLVAWNTQRVAAAEAPRRFEDLLNPRWANRLVMVQNYEMWYKALFDRLTGDGMSVEEFERVFRHIAADSNVTSSSNPASAFLASGQYTAGININLNSITRIDGAPIAFEPVVGAVPLLPNGIGLARDAHHPAAALLFAHWYLTDGVPILQEEQFIQQSPNETRLDGAPVVRPELDDLDSARLQEWREAYDALLRGGDEVLPAYVRGGTP
ncbi:ABC transporter substrate-binding protein [Saccharomonospora sp. NPDC046836]|uniref:ABC transporter substrate-binding protein n=1 Tax=Saccharomonospora sp. NPDC046836 TaxID=3156921 RepID=UPI0033DB4311